MNTRPSNHAWQLATRVIGGISRRLLHVHFDDLMSLGCTIIHRFENSTNLVSLTFDDGPQPDTTRKIIATLARHSVHATFFVIGDNARRYPDLVRALQYGGHEIGNHSYTHQDLHRLQSKKVRLEVRDCQQTLRELTGTLPTLFRAPFGHFRWELSNGGRLDGIQSLVHWDVAPPHSETNPSRLTDYIVSRARPGSIIVLHDGLSGAHKERSRAVGDTTAACLESLIPALRARQLDFRTISEQLTRR